MAETIVVTENVNNLTVSSVGVQGPAGRTILNGDGAPSANLGAQGDFYYDKLTTRFYGPKLQETTWDGVTNYLLSTMTLTYPFSMSQVQNAGSYYFVEIQHNMAYNPNVTVKNSAGDVLETGIDYNNTNKITLIMAQPFGGTAYLS